MKIRTVYDVIGLTGAVLLGIGIFFLAGGAVLLASALRAAAYLSGSGAFVVLAAAFLIIGVIFIITGGILAGKYAVRAKRIKGLIADGKRLAGTIVSAVPVENVTIGGIHPCIAECAVTDPFTGEKRTYVSDGVAADLSGCAGMAVTVYADREDGSNYYVDLSGLAEKGSW